MKITTQDEGRNHLKKLLVDGKVVSWLTVTDYQIRIGGTQVRMGGIGGVQTKEKHRMKGYARNLIEDTLKYMEDEGYDVSMLFGIPNFYAKFGYAVCSASHRLTVSTRDAEDARREAGGYQIRKIEKENIGSVLVLYNENNQNRTCSLVRTKEYFSGFSKGTRLGEPTDSFAVEDSGRRVLAYAVFDKSETEVNVVEVESREDKLFPAILYEFAKMAIERRCGHISFFAPPDHPFAQFLHKYGCKLTSHYAKNNGGMMRIINQRTLFEKMKGELNRRISDFKFENYPSYLEITTEKGSTKFKIQEGFLSICSGEGAENFLRLPQSKLTQLVTGHRTARDILNEPEVEASVGVESFLNVLFPRIVPYIWLADHF